MTAGNDRTIVTKPGDEQRTAALLPVTGERHHVRLHGDASALPGEYTLRDGASVIRQASSEPCPYCRQPMMQLVTTGAFRIKALLGDPVDDAQTVLADQVPSTHHVLKCDECMAIFTRNDDPTP